MGLKSCVPSIARWDKTHSIKGRMTSSKILAKGKRAEGTGDLAGQWDCLRVQGLPPAEAG